MLLCISSQRHRGVYRLSTKVLVVLMGVLPVGVKVPLAVSVSCLACLSRRLPAAVSLILIVAVSAAESAR